MENIKKGILELAIVLMAATCLVLVMVLGFGTLFSGWHLVDDHQFFSTSTGCGIITNRFSP